MALVLAATNVGRGCMGLQLVISAEGANQTMGS